MSCGAENRIKLIDSRRVEMDSLTNEVLGSDRDAGIAVNHALIVHQKSASEKPNQISGLNFMYISDLCMMKSGGILLEGQSTPVDIRQI